MRNILFFLVVVLVGASACGAAPGPQPQAGDTVKVGIYVNRVFDLSLRDNKFSADFYLWFRWQNRKLDPISTFEIVNGQKDMVSETYRDEKDGMHYAFARVNATITQYWDISKFPFDDHILSIQIEDGENDESTLVYSLDEENVGKSPGIKIPGWRLDRFYFGTVPQTYSTNYGDPSLPPDNRSVYSRFYCSVSMTRPGAGYFIKLFLGVLLSALISFMSFFISPTDLQSRTGLGVGAIFAAVGSQYVIASSLPDTNIMTMADQLHIAAFVFIFLSILVSVVTYNFNERGRPGDAERVDRFCRKAFPIVYGTVTLLIILFR
jgi:hypothetical protein